MRLFLCGDVMTGRGIDQILPHPCDPQIHEPYVTSALDYVRLAEQANGAVARPSAPAYVWGDALDELERAAPDARIVNLETAVTRSDRWVPKGINYRMSPENIGCLTAARIDCCTLANNHVLDWNHEGLRETLDTLQAAGIRTAGAGEDIAQAERPAVLQGKHGGRILVVSYAASSSGVPPAWAAGAGRPGVAFLEDLAERTAARIAADVAAARRPGDLVVASVHWGSNWDYEVSRQEQRFARSLIEGGVDLFHGHSSHHVKGIEVYRRKLILYGCGDLINDYEGIGGREVFRGDLALMYFPALDAGSGELLELQMSAMQMHRLRCRRAAARDVAWLRATLDREGSRFGTRSELQADGRLELRF